DLAAAGFDVVSFGDTLGPPAADGLTTLPRGRLEQAADQVVTLLHDAAKREQITNHNWKVARENFSYEVLAELVTRLAGDALEK
ncbi:MAG: hypothetical protein ACLFNT_03980, partial [Spirochaetales bacterium]